MKIILPTAGKGTRLRPLTLTKQKSLIPLAGKTPLGHIIDRLLPLNPDMLIFIVDKNGQQIRDYISKTYPDLTIPVKYLIQEEQKGTGHAVWVARDLIEEKDDVLVVFNDCIAIADLTELNDSTILCNKTDHPEDFGILQIENNQIKKIIEKPKDNIGNLAVIGMYYFKNGRALMESLDKLIKQKFETEIYINYAIHDLIEKGEKFIPLEADEWLDCGTPENLLRSNAYLLSHGHQKKADGINLTIIPPVFIGENCELVEATIGPDVSIGNNTEIRNTKIINSIIGNDVKIEKSEIVESIIGDKVQIIEKKGQFLLGEKV